MDRAGNRFTAPFLKVNSQKKLDCHMGFFYLVGSYFAVADAGGPEASVDQDPDLGPEQGTDSHMAGQGQRRPSAWNLGQCVWLHC